jgi:hypothetical protein
VPIASGKVFVAQGLPNPFRNHVNVAFALPQASRVVVEIFAANGRRVETLMNGPLPAGQHSIAWSVNRDVPSGVYFYKVLAGDNRSTGKITRVD